MRREILRRAALYTYGLLALAVFVAVAGSAFIAWIFTAVGLPFLRTWIALTVFCLAVPAIGQLVLRLRERWRYGSGE